jgi:hypothetical protein
MKDITKFLLKEKIETARYFYQMFKAKYNQIKFVEKLAKENCDLIKDYNSSNNEPNSPKNIYHSMEFYLNWMLDFDKGYIFKENSIDKERCSFSPKDMFCVILGYIKLEENPQKYKFVMTSKGKEIKEKWNEIKDNIKSVDKKGIPRFRNWYNAENF